MAQQPRRDRLSARETTGEAVDGSGKNDGVFAVTDRF